MSSQVNEAVAELERAMMRERSKAGLRGVCAQRQVGGNPGLLAGDHDALRQLWAARDETYFRKLEATAESWLPLVGRHRPDIA
nr:hypothetical protein [Paracoccus sp. M09]